MVDEATFMTRLGYDALPEAYAGAFMDQAPQPRGVCGSA